MSEGAGIYLLLWLLYFSESYIWIRKQTLAFVSSWHGRWHVRLPSSFIATMNGGAVLLNPLWPGTQVALASLAPVSISPDGICVFNAQSIFDVGRPAQAAHHFCFEDIKSCTSDNRCILINSDPFVECASAAESRQMADIINQTLRLPFAERQTLILRFLAQRFDEQPLSTFTGMLKRLQPLEAICWLFFLFLFLATPPMAFRYGLEAIIIPAAIVMIIFAAVIAAFVWREQSSMGPSLASERWATAAKIIFCPPGAIRAVADLTAKFPVPCDPLVISALLPVEERQRFALAYLRDLRFPIKDELPTPAKTVVDWHRAELLNQAMSYLQTRTDLKLDALAMPPARDGAARSYCPRCQSQFTTRTGECTSCDGVQLRALQSEPSSSARSATVNL